MIIHSYKGDKWNHENYSIQKKAGVGIPWKSSGLGLGVFTARDPGLTPGGGSRKLRSTAKKKKNLIKKFKK